MQATFLIQGPGDPPQWLDEAAAHAALAAGERPDSDGVLMGMLRITDDAGTTLEFKDDLQFLVHGLCLRLMRRLATDDSVQLRMASWPKRYLLKRVGSALQVLEDETETVATVELAATAAALRDCARRFADYVAALVELDDDWAGLHALLVKELAI